MAFAFFPGYKQPCLTGRESQDEKPKIDEKPRFSALPQAPGPIGLGTFFLFTFCFVNAMDEEWDADPAFIQKPSRDLQGILADIEIFRGLTRQELRKVGWLLHTRIYVPNEVIVQQGAPGVGMYIIQSGSADVRLERADGRVIHLATLGAPQFFGEMSLLDGSPRAASVVARDRVKALGFFKADLMDLLEHSPRLGQKIVREVSRNMARRLSETLKEYRQVTRQLRVLKQEQAMGVPE